MSTTELRTLVAAVDREISALPHPPGSIGTASALAPAWATLVKFLALDPEPETRKCPACGSVGMRAATRCGQCWTSLNPLPPS